LSLQRGERRCHSCRALQVDRLQLLLQHS
jgi:hypothetical protein